MKYRSIRSKLLAMLLVMAMVVGFFPAKAQAAEESLSLGEGRVVTLNPGETTTLTFTPEESGQYAFYREGWDSDINTNLEIIPVVDHWETQMDGKTYHGDRLELVAGTEYRFELTAWDECPDPQTDEYFIGKLEDMTSIALPDTAEVWVDEWKTVEMMINSLMAFDENVEVTSSDPEVLVVGRYYTNQIELSGISAGTAVVTVALGDMTTSCTVTVKAPIALELDTPVEVTKEEGKYQFTAPETGLYWVYWPYEDEMSYEIPDQKYTFYTRDNYGLVTEWTAGETYHMNLNVPEDSERTSMSEMKVTRVTEATDIAFPEGSTVMGKAGQEISYPFELIGGEVVEGLQVVSADENIAWVGYGRGNEFTVYFEQPGETFFTVTTANGIEKILTVRCVEYGYDAVAEWSGYLENDSIVRLEYTPEHDGMYFVNSLQDIAYNITGDSAQPVTSFEWIGEGYWGCGKVYQLESGKTYYWEPAFWFECEYNVFLFEVEPSTTLDVPDTLTGKVNEQIWLDIILDGAGSTEVISSNTDVAIVGGGNAVGNDIWLVGEGTAEITVTDCWGNKAVCTVTVVGEETDLTFWGWDMLAIAEGKSVTYSYTPEETGMYWLSVWDYTEGLPAPEIKVADAEGNLVESYKLSMQGNAGIVVDLNGGEKYQLTITGTASYTYWLGAERAAEATGIFMDELRFEGEQGTLIGRSFELTGESDHTLVADVNVISTDPEVVEILSFSADHFEAELVGGGTADIIISLPNGASHTFTVVSEGIDSVAAGEDIEVTLNDDESVKYLFVPEESGTYVFVTSMTNKYDFYEQLDSYTDYDFTWHHFSSIAEGISGVIGYDMDAGEKYTIQFQKQRWSDSATTNIYRIEKTNKVTGFELTCNGTEIYAGSIVNLNVQFDSYLAMEGKFKWDVTGEGAFEILGGNNIDRGIRFDEVGTYTVTVSCGDIQDSITITVNEPIAMELDKKYDVTEGSAQFEFTAKEAGTYFFRYGKNDSIEIHDTWGAYDEYWYSFNDCTGWVVKLNEGDTYHANVYAYAVDEDQYGTGTVTITKVTEATDVIINNGEPIVGYAHEWNQIPITLVGGDVIDLYFDVEDYKIADVYWDRWQPEFFNLEGYEPGTTTLTVTGSNGINKTIQVTCVEYNYDAVANWNGTANSEVIVLEYTPAKTGLYFLNTDYEHGLDVWIEEGAQPLYWFGYETDFYHGMAYKLETGKTYYFTTYVGYGEEYDIYLKPVKESTTIKAESTFSGKVNEVGWLPIELDGVGGLDAYSSNEEVVIPGGWNTGGMSLLCVGEGTAVVTIVDQHGGELNCTVTVEGQVEIGLLYPGDWSREAGLGSGKSITYRLPADLNTSEMFWFYSEGNVDWDISVTNSKGAVLSGFDYDEFDIKGKVFDLDGDETYYVTYTNRGAATRSFVGAAWCQEATDVELADGYFAGFEGEKGYIWIDLFGEDEYRKTVADLTITSSDPTIAKVAENTGHEIVLDLLKEGTVTITATLPNGKSDSQTITVWKTSQLALNQQYTNELKVYEDHYDVAKYVFTPAESGIYTLKATADGYVIFDVWDTAGFGEVFEINAATKTFELELTAGKECSIYIANGAEVPGTATVTWSLEGEVKDGWNLKDGKWTYVENGNLVIGWKKIGGSFYYFDAKGIMKTGWIEDGGKWYYTNGSGIILTGWQQLGKTWYYFNAKGVMQTGWLQLGSTWYYLNTSGGMVTGTYVIDGAVNEFNSSGVWLGYAANGWKQMNGNWYYLSNGGKFTTGWKLLGSTWYYFDAQGVMQTGWQVIDGADYFFHAGGGMATGWVQDGSIWYYMNSSGRKVTGDVMIDGALNRFDEEGVWLGYAPAGWRQDGNNWYYLGSGGKITTGWKLLGKTWYYFNANGVMQTGWLQLGSTWYYLNTSGGMVTGTYVIDGAMNEFNSSGVWLGYSKAGWKQVNNQWYYLGNGGKVMKGWQLIGAKTWYYFNAEGVMQTGWLQLGNTKYYLTESGAMVTGTYVIDGVTYEFNSSGALVVK